MVFELYEYHVRCIVHGAAVRVLFSVERCREGYSGLVRAFVGVENDFPGIFRRLPSGNRKMKGKSSSKFCRNNAVRCMAIISVIDVFICASALMFIVSVGVYASSCAESITSSPLSVPHPTQRYAADASSQRYVRSFAVSM